MSLNAVIFGPHSKKHIKDFLALPRRLYDSGELMQNEKEERAFLTRTHVLSHYFTVTSILVYEGGKAVSRGILTVYPEDEVAYLGFFESENNSAAAALLFHTAFEAVKNMGLKKIIGPVDCSFWIKYRLKTNAFGSPYTGEPYNKDYYLNLWEENGFQVWEQYSSNHYMVVENDEGCEKYMKRLAQKLDQGYEIKSPDPRDFHKTMREVYGLLIELYSVFPTYKRITEAEFCKQFEYLKSILNYSMVKMAYYRGEAVGFFVSIPNYGNTVYGKIHLWELPAILAKKKKPDSYVMLYMGVDPKHKGLGSAFAEAIRSELKIQQVPSVGALIRNGNYSQNYVKKLIDFSYEYVLLERWID
ncbi:MAG: hypothetical protein K2N89_12285 [Lachnospiraceae bacterium]|nr:hypothetical protein [Lachnospiraceae bacterium]